MMVRNDFLQALNAERKPDAEVFKKPQYAGIMNIVTELYPDNAHFIYELLQNAEDAQATKITFCLELGKLIVEHNGTRLFSEKDVESITSIGNSTKRTDITQIGKFGVGFKAVFSYTSTPAVHSGDFSFEIQDLIVPKQIIPLDKQTKTTIFEFPFDNPKKLAQTAVEEIEKGLCALGDNTLLFLSYIRKIAYTLPDGKQGLLQRIDRQNGYIEIHVEHPHGDKSVSHWLHFEKDVEVNTKTCRVAIAYQLKQYKSEFKSEIISVPKGQVSIYFPAEKETSKLRFHLHAPFASTVARDSVRDCPENEQLRDHLAELIVESLTSICNKSLLTMSFLAVLPNPRDELSSFYEPIRERIVEAFKTQELTPTKNGKYAKAENLYRGIVKISDVINDTDLKFLTDDKEVLWVANAPQQYSSEEDKFLRSLAIKEWGLTQLSNIFKPEYKEKIELWLSKKDDNWMMRFYELLKEPKESHDKISSYPYSKTNWQGLSFPLVRVNSKDTVKHVIGNQAYFSPEDNSISPPSEINIVKLSVYTKGKKNGEINESAKAFLKSIGVKPFDEKAAIELRLAHYQSPPKQVDDSHYEDIKQFIAYWKKNPEEKTFFQTHTFLLGNFNDKLYWQKSTELCLDHPFLETGLAELVEIHQKKVIWQRYSEKLIENELKDFVEFVKAIGAMYKLEIKEEHRNTGYSTGYSYDYLILNLEDYLKVKKISASKLVWNVLIETTLNCKANRTLINRTYSESRNDSTLIRHLKEYAWIPNKSGEFCTPQTMTREDLRDDFPFNNVNGLLTAIEFGKGEKDQAEALSRQVQQANSAYQAKNTKAQELGFKDAEQAERLARLMEEKGLTIDEIENKFSPKNDIERPTKSVGNTARRRTGVLEHRDNAPSKESITRERSIQFGVTEDTAMAKAYLRAIYENIDKQLICQLCQKEMPFKIKETYYFEAVQCVRSVDKRYYENRLALCPTCAAMYKHARDTNCDEMTKLIIECDAPETTPSVEIPIKVTGENYSLYFVGTHWFDLKTVLEKPEAVNLEP